MKVVLDAALPHLGIVRTLPLPLVYGPIKYQGLGKHNLWVTQGIAHLEMLVNHGYSSKDSTSKLLCTSAQAMMLELGSGKILFEDDYHK